MPHSLALQPKWVYKLIGGEFYGTAATPTIIYQVFDDASMLSSIWTSNLCVPDLQTTLPTIFSQS